MSKFMAIERLLKGRQITSTENTIREEYAVMVISSKDIAWGNGLELTFQVTAHLITPDSDLDDFWRVGSDKTNSDEGEKFNRARYRIMASSSEEAIRLALGQSISKDSGQRLLNEVEKEGPLKRAIKKLHF